jgi:hypothetical protein
MWRLALQVRGYAAQCELQSIGREARSAQRILDLVLAFGDGPSALNANFVVAVTVPVLYVHRGLLSFLAN